MLLKSVVVALFVIAATIQIVRTAVVAAWTETDPVTAAAIWPNHPEVQRAFAMAEVGRAAGNLQDPAASTLQRFKSISSAAPLSVEPFLVHAAVAQRAGNNLHSEKLLVEARQRAPRSAAARYLLADVYLRTGRTTPALAEMAVLSQLFPGLMQQLAPALAHHATMPGAVPQMREILRRYPHLEPAVLSQLATDTRNLDLILSLASGRSSSGALDWQRVLLTELVQEGEYERALNLWTRLSRVPEASGRGLFNGTFRRSSAPPPFNWSFAAGSDGLAEPSDNGLRVLYFGRGDMVLAHQLMLLEPGRYQLEAELVGDPGDGNIAWTISCLPMARQVAQLPLGGRSSTRSGGAFEIPHGCPAQHLELKGFARDLSKSVDLQIKQLRLVRSET